MVLTSEQITDYASLQTQVANTLNREDLNNDIPLLIQLAEKGLQRDVRCRKLQDREHSITADGDSLPSDFDSLEEWYYHGTTYYGPIEIVPASTLAEYKAQFGATGVPRVASIIDGASVKYGPPPDTTYTTRMLYWRKIVALSATNTTNWLILDSPDIYLFATLVEAEPFLKNDPRMALWKAKLTEALDALDQETQRKQFSGPMVARVRTRRVIGG